MSIFLDHVRDLFIVGVLLSICLAVGRTILGRWLHLRPLEDLSFSLALGSGIVATSLLASGMVGLLSTPVLVIVLGGWAVICWRKVIEIPALSGRAALELTRGIYPEGLVLLSVLGLFLLVQSLAPPTDWDSLMYHLELPRRFLEHGRIYRPIDGIHGAFVGLVHMLYLPLLVFGGPAAPSLLSAAFALLLVGAVHAFCTRFLDDLTTRFAPVLLFATTSLLLVAVTPRVDVTTAFFIFLAHYALLVALTGSERPKPWIALAAGLIGFAVGVKYHALAYGLTLLPLGVLALCALTRHRLRMTSKAGAIALLCAAPWLVKNQLLFGTPLYPIFADGGAPLWSTLLLEPAPPSLASVDLGFGSQIREPFNFPDLFLSPGDLTIEGEGRFYFTNPLLLIFPLALLFLRERLIRWLLIPAVAYLIILLVPFPATNLRYLLPAIPPLTIVSTAVLVRAARRLPVPRGGVRAMVAVVAVGAMLPTLATELLWLSTMPTLAYAVGHTAEREYLAEYPLTNFDDYMKVTEFANTSLPPESRILMLLEARGFYFDYPVIQDNDNINWPVLASAMSDKTCPPSEGISHVLLNAGALSYYARRGIDLRTLRWAEFPDFANRCLEQVWQERGFVLFETR